MSQAGERWLRSLLNFKKAKAMKTLSYFAQKFPTQQHFF